MKKFTVLLICFIFSMCFLTACKVKKEENTINYERKLKQYIPNDKPKTQQSKSSSYVDLSEGPKLRYDAKFGPSDVDFDFKIKNPY